MAESLVAWVALPVVLYVLSVGLGLLVERIVGFRSRPALVAPLGFCLLMCVTVAVYSLEGHGWLAVAITVGAAAAGLISTGRDLGARLAAGWPAVAAVGAYVLVLLPTLASGHWTWTGYNFANDTSFHYLIATWLQDHGTAFPPTGVSTPDNWVHVYLVTNYPIGTHAALATLGELLSTRVEVLYQAFIASMVGLAAMAIATLPRRAVRPGLAAGVAVVATLASLTYQYALQGGLKEMGMLAALAAAAGLATDLLRSETPVRTVVGVAVALAGGLSAYAVAAVPYIGVVALVLLAAMLLERRVRLRRAILPAAAVGIGVLVVLGLPTLLGIMSSAQTVSGTFSTTGAGALGQLARPLPVSQVSGVYLQGDYIFPIANGTASDLTAILTGIVLVLAVLGLVVLAWRADWGPLLFLVPMAVTYLVLSGEITPYGNGKMLALASAGVVLVALCGVLELPRPSRARAAPIVAGAVGTVVIAGGVIASAAFAYHAARLAPDQRLDALRDAAEHLPHSGKVNSLEDEEFAKYFASRPNLDLGFDSITPTFAQTRTGAQSTHYYDADDLTLPYVERFDGMIVRRGPAMSRMPANFHPIYANAWYVVWRKVPGTRVIEHVPLQALDRRSLVPDRESCAAILRAARLARAPGRQLVASVRPPTVVFDPSRVPRPEASDWQPQPDIQNPDVLRIVKPGLVFGSVRVTTPGRYRVWLRGSLGRAMVVSIDGRPVGDARGLNSNEQYLRAGFVDLGRGRHEIELRRGGGNIEPGDGASSYMGPLVLERMGPARVVTVDPSKARSLCSQSLDWVEVVERRR